MDEKERISKITDSLREIKTNYAELISDKPVKAYMEGYLDALSDAEIISTDDNDAILNELFPPK